AVQLEYIGFGCVGIHGVDYDLVPYKIGAGQRFGVSPRNGEEDQVAECSGFVNGRGMCFTTNFADQFPQGFRPTGVADGDLVSRFDKQPSHVGSDVSSSDNANFHGSSPPIS